METTKEAAMMVAVQRRAREKQSGKKAGEDTFDFQCRQYRLPSYVRQFKMLKSVQTPRADGKAIPKVWRFDFAWPQFYLIVEINGGVWMPGGGAHSHPIDITRNMEKQNDAAREKFFVLQFTPDDVKRKRAIAFVQRWLASAGWKR